MSESFIVEVRSLTEKAKKLRDDYNLKFKKVKEREKIHERINSKLTHLKSIQQNIIPFNIGGSIFPIYRGLIFSSRYNSIFKQLICKYEQEGIPLGELKNHFIDRSPSYFLHVLEILRIDEETANVAQPGQTTQYTLGNEVNIDNFIEDLNFYFEDDSLSLLENFSLFFKDLSLNKVVKYELKNTVFVSMDAQVAYQEPPVLPYTASSVNALLNSSSSKAVFLSVTSTLTFELVDIKEVSRVKLKPFYDNNDVWIATEGAGTFVFGSLDKSNWDMIGVVPDNFGSAFGESYYVDLFSKYTIQYLRFETGDFMLSISHIKLE